MTGARPPEEPRPSERCRWARGGTTTCRTQDHCNTCDQPQPAEAEQP
jgi:hypothetical protein